MKRILIAAAAMAIAACSHQPPAQCDDGDVSPIDYIDQQTGKLHFDEAGDVLDPRTDRIVITAAQVRCRERNDQAALDAWNAAK